MTRFIHDQFAKDYLEELLSQLGECQISLEIPSEIRQVDVFFCSINSIKNFTIRYSVSPEIITDN